MYFSPEKFAHFLKVQRADHELNQSELAKKINASTATIVRYEAGEMVPSFENACKIADIFGCSLDDLVEHESI